MKTLTTIALTIVIAGFLGLNSARAEKGKTITLKGRGMCAKCCLKEADTCQNVIEVNQKGKKTKYYLAQNDVSKDFHSNICKKIQPIEVTGTCKKEGDKFVVTADSIKLAAAKKKKGK